MNSNGSIGRWLWESFDHPTDTLLPGMKLGVNHKTGRKWSLTSWLASDDPASGVFTLEWEPKKSRLIIKRRGVPYWSSGLIVKWNNVLLFDNMNDQYHTDQGKHFTYYIINNVTDPEEYFTYSIDAKYESLLYPQDGGRSAWQLQYWGPIMDRNVGITEFGFCYGYGMEDEGCERWNQPKCRSHKQNFQVRSGRFANSQGLGYSNSITPADGTANLSSSDCRAYCWNDCDCLGYGGDSYGPGCYIWEGKLQFVQDNSGRSPRHYVISTEPSNKGKKKEIMLLYMELQLSHFNL